MPRRLEAHVTGRATVPSNTTTILLIVVAALISCDGDLADSGTCALNSLAPGIGDVVPAPRPDVVAEVLALSRGNTIGADPGLYASLSSDLALITATDSRMRLDVITERNAWPYLYSFDPVLAHPPILFTLPGRLDAARAAFDSTSCAYKLTEGLHGTAVERTDADSPFVEITFPARLETTRLKAAYARLGIALEAVELSVTDGAKACVRDVASGREYLLELRGGDCPAGCTFVRSFWWRVASSHAELVAEFGMSLNQDGGSTPAPSGFDTTGFHCAGSGR
jgi:hypothetical protein